MVLVLLVVLVASVVMFEPLTEAVTPELFRTRVLNIFSKGACMLENLLQKLEDLGIEESKAVPICK